MSEALRLLRCLVPGLIFAATCLVSPSARAHEFRPASLDITSLGGGRYDVAWNPAPGADRVHIVFPESCSRATDAGSPLRFVLDCGPSGLGGQSISARGLAPLRDEVLVRMHLAPVSGRDSRAALGGDSGPARDSARDSASGSTTELTAMLTVARPSVDVPAHDVPGSPGAPNSARAPAPAPSSAPALATVRSYFLAGAEHLITGLDHVLFVLVLLLLLRRPAPIARAVTAFTVAHSVTLALTVLGAVRLPPAPVEAAIALSVLFLAREILRPREQTATTLLSQRPWVAAFAFGLLHGLGFAGGLASFHLAREGLALALLGFNLGLEAAQLGLILVALAVARPLARLALRKPAWTLRAPAYSLGAAAAFWVFQRVAAFWSS